MRSCLHFVKVHTTTLTCHLRFGLGRVLCGGLLCLLLASFTMTAWSHNLNQRADYVTYDQATMAMFQTRAAAGQPLMQTGDTIGLVLKATPNAGTPTGSGGYSTFFIPIGTQVVQAQYGRIDPSGAFIPMAVKGQSILALGDGLMGSKKTTGLIGLQLGPNITGQTAYAVDSTGLANGTMAGIYADTGLFYSTDPKTAWQSWANTGGMDSSTSTATDNFITNNNGDVVVPTTRWDAEQLIAFGMKSPGIAILDPVDQRGNAPWGMGSGVAGPECGYAWCFNKTYWDAHASDPIRMQNAISVGPWQRIKYDGSQASQDVPGLKSSKIGYVGVDASSIGYDLSPSNPLPLTTSWSDNTSPKAVRIAWGNLELYRPEYARLQVKIVNGPGQTNSPFNAAGFLQAYVDTFGGDAGGEYNNFDHLWRYYTPTTAQLSGEPFVSKQASNPLVLTNQVYTYQLWAINFGSTPLTHVVVQDSMPDGLQFISAVPAPTTVTSGLLKWNLGTMAPQSMQSFVVTAKATQTGVIINTLSSVSDQYAQQSTTDTVVATAQALLYADKSVTPSVAQPGDSVSYTITISNNGTAANVAPLVITENLPSGFTYTGLTSASLNGSAAGAGVLQVNPNDTTHPVFAVEQGINAGQTLTLTFTAQISGTEPPGSYTNSYKYTYSGKVLSTGALAPVTVAAAGVGVGNLVFFDANGNGHADPGEGVANVALELYTESEVPEFDAPVATTTTDANGLYLFDHLQPGFYVVHIPSRMFQPGAPLYSDVVIAQGLFGDDDVGQDGLGTTDPPTEGVSTNVVSLFPGECPTDQNGETGTAHTSDNAHDASVDLTIDFGFQTPVGIGNLVFIDANHNGHADPGEGVGGVTVEVYHASDPVESGLYLYSTTTRGDGHYLFDHLGNGDYVVHIPAINFAPGHPLAGLLSVPDVGVPLDSDDDIGENGIDAISPILTGISSNVIHLVAGQAPVDAPPGSTSGETGFLSTEDDNGNDANIDLTVDFGFTDTPPALVGVGNLVFKDANGNGFYDDGEGVDGVTLQLFPGTVTDPLTATPIATTVSSGGGLYLFTGLQPGSYLVFIPPSNFGPGGPLYDTLSLPGQGTDDNLDDDQDENGDDPWDPSISGVKSNVFNLVAGAEPTSATGETGFESYIDEGPDDANILLTIDFGFYEPMGIGNVVFKDLNGNGHYDAGEGVDGVLLQLFPSGADPNLVAPLASTTTANGGLYLFDRLEVGTYFVHVAASNFASNGPLAGLLSVPDSTMNPLGDDDVGEDGIDAPNPALTGISCRDLYLFPGTEPTDATTETGVNATSDDAHDADYDLTIDFGFYDPGAIVIGVGNVVFIDANHNGHYDPGEGVPGVKVQLFPANALPLTDPPLSTTTTDSQGAYLLTTNATGDYLVFIPPSEFTSGHPLYGYLSLPGNGGDDHFDDDVDENGVDSAHPEITGIGSVSIHLAAGTEPTDATGETGFEGTSDDANDSNFNLTVDFGFDVFCASIVIGPGSLPEAYQGTAYAQTLNASGGAGPYTWVLTAGSLPSGITLDSSGNLTGTTTDLGTFSFTVTATDVVGCSGTASWQLIGAVMPTVGVGNCIYFDANNNGIRDANEGVAGVEVELFNAGDDPTAVGPIVEMDTDSQGRYLFNGLPPGDYFVYIPPAEFAPGQPLNGMLSIPGVSGDDGVDDNVPGNDNGIDSAHPEITGIASTVFHLGIGQSPVDSGSETGFDAASDNANGNDANVNLTIDLGFVANCPTITISPASLPPAMTGIPYSQQLTATGGAGATVFAVTAGALPDGMSLSSSGLLAGAAATPGAVAVTISAVDQNGCSTAVQASLVVNNPLGVGNLVFFDANGNGHADPGEGVNGVTVELYHSTDTPGVTTPVASTTTSNGGLYLIDDLPAGDYFLHVPASMFASGAPLWKMTSVPGAISSGDDDVGEHGLDVADPTVTGVSTAVFTLATGTEPVDSGIETGTDHTSDNARDADVDLTQDFGFIDLTALPATFASWAASQGLAGGNASPAANPDGDAFSNLMEYALGLNPNGGADNATAAFAVVHNTVSGNMDAQLRRRHGGQADLTYTLQVIPNLTGASWTATAVTPQIVDNGDGTETLTFASLDQDPALLGSSYGFARLFVSLDANHDGMPEAADTSMILGWQRRLFAAQNQTYAAAFAAPALFTGTIDAVAGNALNVTTSAGSASVVSLLAAGFEYYVEVTSGNNKGHRWEVDGVNSTATSIALLPADVRSTQTVVPSSLAGDLIALRPHWRVADLFPPALYTATNNASTADQVLLWDPTAGGYVTLWLANYFSQKHWHQVGNANLNATSDSRSIAPGAGAFVHPRNSVVNSFAIGQLRTWQTACPLPKGACFMGNPFPVAQSPQLRGMTFANGFTASTNPVNADRIYIWSGDTSATTGYVTYQLLKFGSLEIWKIVGSADLSTNYGTQNLFAPGTAAFIQSINGKPDWMVPAPVVPP